MRQKLPGKPLLELCALFGVSRQAYYLAHQHAARTDISNMVILALVAEFRSSIPMLGTRKLLHMLAPEMKKHDIKMGRDQLYDLLSSMDCSCAEGDAMCRQQTPTTG